MKASNLKKLEDAVKAGFAAGKDEDDIKKILKDGGCSPAEIKKIISSVKAEDLKPSSEPSLDEAPDSDRKTELPSQEELEEVLASAPSEDSGTGKIGGKDGKKAGMEALEISKDSQDEPSMEEKPDEPSMEEKPDEPLMDEQKPSEKPGEKQESIEEQETGASEEDSTPEAEDSPGPETKKGMTSKKIAVLIVLLLILIAVVYILLGPVLGVIPEII